MPRRLERRLVAAILLVLAGSALIALRSPLGTDYGNLSCHLNSKWCDEAAFPLHALIHGDLDGFFAQQPLMGPVTLLLRAPFAALARIGSEDLITVYRLGVFACLLVSGLVAVHVAALMARRGHPLLQCGLVGALILVNPAVFYAIDFGHPEEFVTGALCVASAVFAIERRWALAAVALGLAVGSKPWALLVAVPVLLVVAPPGRVRFALVAALTTLVLYVPMVAGDPGRFKTLVQGAGEIGTRAGTVTPPNVWWLTSGRDATFSRYVAVRDGRLISSVENGYSLPRWLGRATRPLVLALALLLTLFWYRSRASEEPESVLLLMAIILLLRCVLDPGNHSYYHVPAITSLLAYEGLARRGVPWASLVVMGALWATVEINPHLATDRAFALVYLGWTIPAIVAGLWLLFRRSRVAVS